MFDHTGKPIGNPHQTLFPHASTLRHYQRIRHRNIARSAVSRPARTPKPEPRTGRKTVDTRFPPHPNVT
ncbi:MAG: hypothetical protein JWQ42_478 [Edaphobacter sp.]|nr:hypothetical protein [Edaphobacter sp.]